MPITVVIIEDDVNYNKSLKKIIDSDDCLSCIAQYYSGEDALANLAELNADVALVDIKLPDMTGVEVLKRISPYNLSTQYVICTSFEDEETIFNALKLGASGYLLKGESMQKIIASIKEVHLGGSPMSSIIARKVLQYFNKKIDCKLTPENPLTHAENEVITLLAKGLLYKEIAYNKNISMDTVKKHISNIYRKLQVNNKIEAINIVFKK